jgi:hypothetical protein
LLADRAHREAEAGRWRPAIADYNRAIDAGYDPPIVWDRLIRARLLIDDMGGYRRDCARLLERARTTRDPWVAHRAAWACVLRQKAVADPTAPVRLAAFADEAKVELPWRPRFFTPHACVLGAALYRAGQYEASARELERAVERLTKTGVRFSGGKRPLTYRGGTPYEWLFLAMAHHRLDHDEMAQRYLTRAQRRLEEMQRPGGDGRPAEWGLLPWDQQLELRLLLEEAERRLAEKKK